MRDVQAAAIMHNIALSLLELLPAMQQLAPCTRST